VVYLWCLFELTRLPTAKSVSYFGLLAGMLAFAPQLFFFWKLFGPGAIALWAIAAFWIRMFLVLGRSCRARLGPVWAVVLFPFLWTGFEFFRSELYYFRFSWLNEGYVFATNHQWLPMRSLGSFGMGFVLMASVAVTSRLRPQLRRISRVLGVAIFGVLVNLPTVTREAPVAGGAAGLPVAGVQMEFPSELEIVHNLNQLVKTHPDAQLLVLSEYSVSGPVPEKIRDWCRKNNRYLVLGAEDPAPRDNYYDTAFVVGPTGETVFRQGKSVPVQLLKDGLPATNQALWNSPWGKIGFCICYDLSYRRVTDELIRLGAQAIICPTMDVEDWGRHEHELHTRVALTRAAEYGVPIFRVASSGISQAVDSRGQTIATAPMPGDGAMIAARLKLVDHGTLPLDRWIAPLSVGITAVYAGWLILAWLCNGVRRFFYGRRRSATSI
jgi:apolipoprotein N-acyltransferase